MSEDLYEILGLDKGCNEAQIKKAYKKLAMKWHPDKHTNESPEKKKEADMMFKKISEAYQVLIDPNKRKDYDMFGGNKSDNAYEDFYDMYYNNHSNYSNYSNYGNMKFNHFFRPDDFINMNNSDPFNHFRGFTNMHKQKPAPKDLDLNVTLEELSTGTTKNIVLKRKIYDMYGNYKVENDNVAIEIKPGYREGTKLKFDNKGNVYYGNVPCDVIFTIKELKHNTFTREKDDLVTIIDITYEEALNGFKRVVKNLNGSNIMINLPGIKNSSYVHKITGAGMPIRKSGNVVGKGDILVKFNVTFNKKN